MSNESGFATVTGSGGPMTVTVLAGIVSVNGANTAIPQTVISLSPSATNSIYISSSGVLTVGTAGFPTGCIPLSTVITTPSSISSLIDARPDDTVPGSSGSGPASTSTTLTHGILGLPVTNLKVISTANSIATAAGDTDLYTVPSNKKALVVDTTFTVPTGNPSSVTCFAQFKTSGVYTKYDFVCNNNTAGTLGGTALLVPMLLVAGESFAVNCNNAGISLWPMILEFDSTAAINISRITSLSVGDNTVFTLTNNGVQILSNIESVAAGAPFKGSLYYFNNSGISRTIGWNLVPSGGSPGNSNQIGSGISVSSPAVSLRTYYGGSKTGDFVSVNTDANTAGQVAWVIYQYLP